jgi:hypothetical protein
MKSVDISNTLGHELRYFDSDAQRSAFHRAHVTPYDRIETWAFGSESHVCTVVASNGDFELVYCSTGFGPSFPWSVQRPGQTNLGTDAEWCAYLYEAFVGSSMWLPGPPQGFMLFGPGEREA